MRTISCSCGNTFEVAVELIGKNIRCLRCAQLIAVSVPLEKPARPAPLKTGRGSGSPIDPMTILWSSLAAALAVGLWIGWSIFKPMGKKLDEAVHNDGAPPSKLDVPPIEPKQPRSTHGFIQPLAPTPEKVIADFRFEQIETKEPKMNGAMVGNKMFELRLHGTPDELRDAISKVYPKVTRIDQVENLLRLRHKIHEVRRALNFYAPGNNCLTDMAIRDACSLYVIQYDQLIREIEDKVAPTLIQSPTKEAIRLALLPPDTGFGTRILASVQKTQPKLAESMTEDVVAAADKTTLAGLRQLLKSATTQKAIEALAGDIDTILATAAQMSDTERGQVYATLLRGSPKPQLKALFSGAKTATGWTDGRYGREYLEMLHAKSADALTAKERLELGKTIPFKLTGLHLGVMDLMAKWSDKLTVDEHAALLEEAIKTDAGTKVTYSDSRAEGKVMFFRCFVRHRFEELGEDGVRKVLARVDAAALGRLLFTGLPAGPHKSVYNRASRAHIALVLRNADYAEKCFSNSGLLRSEIASVAIEEMGKTGITPAFMAMAKSYGSETEIEALLASQPEHVMTYLDMIKLSRSKSEVRKKILEALVKSFEAKEPRPSNAHKRDELIKEFRKDYDALPGIVNAYHSNSSIKKNEKNKVYVLELIMSLADDRLVAFLVAELKSTKDAYTKGQIESALRSATGVRAKDWQVWYNENKSKLPKQLRSS